MNFSPQQAQALDRVAAWLKTDEQVLYLAGYAGTGKTSLAQHLHASHYAAYTGKAALVLRQMGCHATTIHQLIYNPKEKSQARLRELLEMKAEPRVPGVTTHALDVMIEAERENLQRPSFVLNLDSPLRQAKLVVIDECSMVNEQVGQDLESFGCKILVLGDPAQLPPVYGGGYFTSRKPDILLTEIHRQARDNPILDLATRIRTTGRLPRLHPLVVPKATEELALGVDQLIVGRNATRHTTNRRMRQLLGFAGSPQPGERVVCLRNDHQLGLLNGALYMVEESNHGHDSVDMLLYDETTNMRVEVEAHPELFVGEEVDYRYAQDLQWFDYGYALTCHKSQGSQWDSVGVIDESGAFRKDAGRWLYTAVTRAAKELWVSV